MLQTIVGMRSWKVEQEDEHHSQQIHMGIRSRTNFMFKKKKKKKKGRNRFLDVILKILNQINQLIFFYNVAFQDSIIGIEEEICLS